jgi:hypothetical protein
MDVVAVVVGDGGCHGKILVKYRLIPAMAIYTILGSFIIKVLQRCSLNMYLGRIQRYMRWFNLEF